MRMIANKKERCRSKKKEGSKQHRFAGDSPKFLSDPMIVSIDEAVAEALQWNKEKVQAQEIELK